MKEGGRYLRRREAAASVSLTVMPSPPCCTTHMRCASCVGPCMGPALAGTPLLEGRGALLPAGRGGLLPRSSAARYAPRSAQQWCLQSHSVFSRSLSVIQNWHDDTPPPCILVFATTCRLTTSLAKGAISAPLVFRCPLGRWTIPTCWDRCTPALTTSCDPPVVTAAQEAATPAHCLQCWGCQTTPGASPMTFETLPW